jgi:hypothetical protein
MPLFIIFILFHRLVLIRVNFAYSIFFLGGGGLHGGVDVKCSEGVLVLT